MLRRSGEAWTALGLKTYLGALSGPVGCPLGMPRSRPHAAKVATMPVEA